jgi:alanine racemase
MEGSLPRTSTADHESTVLTGGRLTVDLDALAANFARLAGRSAPARCGAVVKADAYGLGVVPVARRLAAAGCDCFFVANLREGQSLRAVLPDADIYVLEGQWPGQAAAFLAARLLPVINSPEQLRDWADPAAPRRCMLQVDTGMSRLGLRPEDARALAAAPGALAGLQIDYLSTHLACADEAGHPATIAQLALFAELRALLPSMPVSIGNTAGVLDGAGSRGDLVRAGIGLYGGNPRADQPNTFQTVATLEGRVLQLRDVPASTPVGYGAEFRVRERARLATLGIGYADGYPRSLGNRGYAAIRGQRVPVVGRVSMDSIVIDITTLPEAALQVGDFVQLLGAEVRLDDLATLAGTISYEMLTRLGPRLQRRYVGGA